MEPLANCRRRTLPNSSSAFISPPMGLSSSIGLQLTLEI